MGDWWGRVGSVVAVGTGLGYLLGAATISEFARAFGLRASDLDLGVRDYVVVATAAAVGIVYVGTTILLLLLLLVDSLIDVIQATKRRAAREDRTATQVEHAVEVSKNVPSLVMASSFFLGILLLPTFLLGEGKIQLINTAFSAATSIVVVVLVLLPALLDRRRRRRAVFGGRVDDALAVNSVVWTLRWLRQHPVNALVVFLLFYVLSLVSASWIGQEYGRSVLASSVELSGELPNPPLLLRWTVNPARACILPPEPQMLQRRPVVHLGSGSGGKVILIYGGRTILLGGDAQLSFPDCPA